MATENTEVTENFKSTPTLSLPLRGRGDFFPTNNYSFPLRGKVGMGVVQIRFPSVFSVLSVAKLPLTA
jgi:hypothetical protein